MPQWWLHNPIADLPGPQFLALYFAVVAALIFEALWRRRRGDHTLDLGIPPVPVKPDPLAWGYLRGGPREVTRLLVFDLLRRGVLANHNGKIARGTGEAQAGKLSDLEQTAFVFFEHGKSVNAIFQGNGLVSWIEPRLAPIVEALREEELIPPAGSTNRAIGQWAVAASLLAGLGGYKLLVALQKGHHNVGFLVLMGFAGLAALALAYRVPRQTLRGQAYLRRLAEAYDGLRSRVTAKDGSPPKDQDVMMVSSVFGVGSMQTGPHADHAALFHQASSTGGCGGSCGGGGGCGGGGCGGGCGGCGG